MRVWKGLAICLVAAGLSSSVFAQGIQSTTGNLYGKVTDESGGVLPGVTITVSGVGAPRTVTTGNLGDFRFVNIDPGTYSIKADMAGFASVERTNVRVSTGSNTEVTIPMKISSVAATVTVTGEVPLLDTRKLRTGTNFSNEELKDIPTSRDPWGILQMSAGVLTDHVITGANENGQQSVFVGKGTNFSANNWNMDGIPITDQAASGGSPAYYDFEAFQEMQMSTGGADPSSATPGVTVNFLTKRGTNDVHGSGRFFVTPSELEAFNTNREIAERGLVGTRIANVQDYGVEVGGPAWRDHLWLWGSFGHDEIKKIKATGDPDNTQLENYNVKINGQPVESNAITLFYFRGNKTKQGRLPGGAQSEHPTGTNYNQSGPSHFEKIEDSQVFGANVFFTGSYAYNTIPFNLDPQGGTDVDVFRGADSVWHNSYLTDHNYRQSHTVQATGSFFFNTGALGHEIKFGGTYNTFGQRHSRFWPGDEVYGDLSGDSGDTGGAAFPYIAHITRGDVDGQDQKNIGGFIGDTLTTGNLTLNLGLRFDSFYGYNSPSLVRGNPSFPDILGDLNYPGGPADFHTHAWAPRVGITYAIGPQKTTLLRASYSRYAGGFGTSNVAVTNPLGAVQDAQFSWNGLCGGAPCTSGASRITAGDLGPFIGPVGYDPNNPNAAFSPNRIDRNLKPDTTDEFMAGVEQQILPELVAGLTYTYRKHKDLVWNCPLALDNSAACISNSDYSLVNSGLTVHDSRGNVFTTGPIYDVPVDNIPADYTYGLFQTNRDDYSTVYNGVEFQLTKRLSNKWMAHGSFTYTDWKQKVSVAKGCIDPTNQVGYTTFGNYLGGNSCADGDVAYDFFGTTWIGANWQFAISGLYQLPWNFNIAASVFGHQGYLNPYWVLAIPESGLNGGLQFVAVGNADDHRLASVYEADLSLQKVIPIAGKADITLSVNMFNVFNTKTILYRLARARPVTSSVRPTAGLADNQQNPRVLSFGARVSF
jgi:hypothetical protein